MSTTPWHPQATLFRALAEHLGFFPDLPKVHLTDRLERHDGDARLQTPIRAGASAVLAWANTLAPPTIRIRPLGDEPDEVEVKATGGIDDLTVTVWSTDKGGLHRLYQRSAEDPNGFAWTVITLDQLAQYLRENETVTA